MLKTRRQFLVDAGRTGAAVVLSGGVVGFVAACTNAAATKSPLASARSSLATSAASGAAGTATLTPATPTASVTALSPRVQLAWLKNVEFGGYWLADDRGYYAQDQVTPTWLAGGPNLASTAAVVEGGQADIAVGDDLETVARDVAAGADLVVFGAVFQKSPGGILSLPKNPIRTAKDIVGKRIGVQQGATVALETILKMNGYPANSYTPVPVGFDPTPLLQGACDGYVCYVTNQPITLELKGIPYVTALYYDMGRPSYGDVLYTTRQYLQANRDGIVRFLRATIMGWETFVQSPSAAVTLAVDKYGADLGLDPKQQQLVAKAQIPLITVGTPRVLDMSQATVAGPMYKSYKAGGDKNLPSVQDFVDTSIIADAYAGRNSLL